MTKNNDSSIRDENFFELRQIEDLSRNDRHLIDKVIKKFNKYLESVVSDWVNDDYLEPIQNIIKLLGNIESSFGKKLIILFNKIEKMLAIDKKYNKVGSGIIANTFETSNSDYDDDYVDNMNKNFDKLCKLKNEFNDNYNITIAKISELNNLLEYNGFNTLIIKEKIEDLDFYVNGSFSSTQDTVVHISSINSINK